jgi:hypothetical protein
MHITNSFIRTSDHLTVIVNNVPYTIENSHVNFSKIVKLLQSNNYDQISELISVKKALNKFLSQSMEDDNLHLDEETGIVWFQGHPVKGTVVSRILDMMKEGFDVTPMTKFLGKLYKNPSKDAITRLYSWMESNSFTINSDGDLIAYKRVNQNYTSIHDSSTMHAIGTKVSMSRELCDSNSDQTCSTGLHFCARSYLHTYGNGQGRILILAVDPMDVVAIPTDYNNAKGRACGYKIVGELSPPQVKQLGNKHMTDPISTSVYVSNSYFKSPRLKKIYDMGYTDGKKHAKKLHGFDPDYKLLYNLGYSDGRKKIQPKK